VDALNVDESVIDGRAYGLADPPRVARGLDCQRGRYRTNPAAGGTGEAILREVLRRMAIADRGGIEIAREAVDDVVNGRQPRW
jgi:hypothetical protein